MVGGVGIGVCLLGEQPQSIPLPELFTPECALLCHLSPVVQTHKVTAVGTALGPVSTLEMPEVSPSVPQALFSQGHQCRSTEARSQNCSSCAPGPTVGAMEAAQTLAWPSLHVYVPTKPTAAQARHVPAMGAPVVHSDVLQVLHVQSW